MRLPGEVLTARQDAQPRGRPGWRAPGHGAQSHRPPSSPGPPPPPLPDPRPGPPAAQCTLISLETSVLYVALGLARATRPSQAPQAEGLSLSAPSAQTTEGLNERGSHVARVRVGGRAPGAPLLRSWPACVPACEVHFENTRVPVENVLGEVGGGFKVRCLPFQAASCYPGRLRLRAYGAERTGLGYSPTRLEAVSVWSRPGFLPAVLGEQPMERGAQCGVPSARPDLVSWS